jgi:type IX secretion system PorP/SprF family membrane protein
MKNPPSILRYFLLLFSVFPFSFNASAQRDIQYHQYLLNPLAINPAATSVRDNFRLYSSFRRQWTANLQGMPTSQTLAMDGGFGEGDNRKFGMGFQGLLDRTSGLNNTAAFVSAAYHYMLSENQKLSFGVQGGINVLPIFSATSAGNNQAIGSAGAGIQYQSDLLTLGVSMPEILKGNYGNGQNVGAIRYRRPLFIFGSVKLPVAEDLIFEPSVLVATEKDIPFGYDINARLLYRQKLDVGLSYRKPQAAFTDSSPYVHGFVTYGISGNILIGYTYSSRVAEAFNSNDRGIHELVFTLQPNPKNL